MGTIMAIPYPQRYGKIWDEIRLNPGWWFGTFGLFFHIGNFMIPTDEVIIFQRGRSTTKQNQFHGISTVHIMGDKMGSRITPQLWECGKLGWNMEILYIYMFRHNIFGKITGKNEHPICNNLPKHLWRKIDISGGAPVRNR